MIVKKIDGPEFFDFLFLFDLYKKGYKRIKYADSWTQEYHEGVLHVNQETRSPHIGYLMVRWIMCYGISISDVQFPTFKFKDSDIIFLDYGDGENFGNCLNQDIFGKVIMPDGATCKVEKLGIARIGGLGRFLVVRDDGVLRENGNLIYGTLGEQHAKD